MVEKGAVWIMGYVKGLLEYLAEHGYTEGVIVVESLDPNKNGTILRFFFNPRDHEWMIREVE